MKNRRQKEKIRYDRYFFSAGEWVRCLAAGCGLGGFVVWLCYHTWMAVPVGVPLAVWYIAGKKKQLAEDRRKRLNYHFREILSSLRTALSAGYSLENGLLEALKDIKKLYGPDDEAVREMERIGVQIRLQIPVGELFAELGQRSQVEDIRNFAEVLTIARRMGGPLDKILENTERTIRERVETRKEIDAAQAAKKYEQQIMSLVPVGMILYLRFSFDGFIEQLYGNLTGAAVMSLCLGLYLFAFWLGKRMIQTEL